MATENERRLKIDVALPTSLEHGENIGRVDVFHDKGGPNYFSGGYTKTGYYVSTGFIEVRKEEGRAYSTERFVIGGGSCPGRRFHVGDGARFNAKTLQKLYNAVAPLAEKIVALTLVQDHDGVRTLLAEATASVLAKVA